MNHYLNWAIIIIINFITYFIARFGLISNGRKNQHIYIVGLFSHLLSFAYGYYKLGFWGLIILIPISYVFIRGAVTLIIDWLENKLYPNRKNIIKKWAEKLKKDPDDIKEEWIENRFKTDDERITNAINKHLQK
ncbi:MAG: hypothetical protein WCX97_04045 [Candidatus Magasanikbacteria bacterium]